MAGLLCSTAYASSESPATVDDIVVTGSRLANKAAMSVVTSVDPQQLQSVGAVDLSHVLRLVPANSGSEAQIDQLNNPQSSGTAQFNLRNLGLGSTLVMVDGQRWTNSAVVATDGSSFVDINSLVPSIALQRVDFLKDGASAIYGSDAVAGAVNFITRRDTPTPELRARYAHAKGADESSIEGLYGLDTAHGRLLLAGSYLHRSALTSDERDFTQAERYGREGWTAVTSYGQPGSYYLPSTGAFVPDADCENPIFVGSFKNSPSDTFCRLDYSDFFDLMPEEQRTQALADYRGQWNSTSVWAQASMAKTSTTARQSPSLPILSRVLTVPAHHPDNPYNEDVLFRGRLLGGAAGPSIAHFDYITWRAAAGISGQFDTRWNWDVFATSSQQTVHYRKPDAMGTALQRALNGLGGADCEADTRKGCHYYNPFGNALLGTGTTNSPELLVDITGKTALRGKARLFTLDAQTTYTEISWGAVRADMAAGLQFRRNALRHDWNDAVNSGDLLTAGYSPDFGGHQDTYAMFVEGRAALAQSIDIQLAGRYERYNQKHSHFSPKASVNWTPVEGLILRGSWGQGHRAPPVLATSGALAAQPSVFDNGSYVFANTLTSGRIDLKPERSTHWTLGAVWSPLQGLELSADGWSFDYTDLIIKESAQAILDQAAADLAEGRHDTVKQRRITRAPDGTITDIQLYFANAPAINTRGIDFAARYRRGIGSGNLDLSANWTVVDRYDIRVAPEQPRTSGLGWTNLNTVGRSLPKHKAEASAHWSSGKHTLTGLLRYTGSYRNDRSGITRQAIASQTTGDILYGYSLSDKTKLSIGVINITDKAPPLAQFFLGYDPVVADPRGRIISATISQQF